MARRKQLPPDTRLNWRDENMPVLRTDQDGKVHSFSPDKIRSMYEMKMNSYHYPAPAYYDDPSYNWRKKY